MPTLSDYLITQAARPFAWGSADCALLVADWVRARRGCDPVADCRGYAGQAEADALRAGWGGLLRLVGRTARRAGLAMTRAPRPGDIAVVRLGDVTACAIRTERRWAMRLDGAGLALVPLERVRVIAAWRV